MIEQAGIATNNLSIAERMVDDINQVSAFEAKVNGMVKTLSSVTSIAFGFSMISDMFKTLTDDSATLEEKLNAVIMNGLMGLTMLVPGFVELSKIIKTLTLEYALQTGVITAETAAEEANNIVRAKGVTFAAQAIAAKVRETAASVAKTAALVAERVATLALQHPVAALAVGVGALAVGVAVATEAYLDNFSAAAQANQEYERQNEILAETRQNLDDVNQNIESLNSSLDKISDLRSSLDDMTEGTDEWKEAVRELNQEILTLIEIAKFVTNENGVLTLDDEGMNKFYQDQIDKANYLNDVNSIQQINTLNAKNNQLIEQYAQRNNISSNEVRQALAQATEEGIKNGEVKIEGREDLTASFAELASTIISNNATIETLSSTIGSLNDTFENNFADGISIADNAETVRKLSQQFGGYEMFDEYGNSLGFKNADLSAQINDAKNGDTLKALIEQVTGSKILKAEDVS